MNEQNNELKHYGVLGMKWGVHRARNAAVSGNSDRAKSLYSKHYAKASKKIDKLNKKSVKQNLKAAKLSKKAFKLENKAYKYDDMNSWDKSRRKTEKANKKKLKSAKKAKKAFKWTKKMERTFSDVRISDISQESINKGKKYTYMLVRD